MTKEMGYNVGGGCGATIIFGLTKDGDLYAELGGDICEDEDMLETFDTDCGRTLEGIRDDLDKLEDDVDEDDNDEDDDDELDED
jgi:hypothetical protein